MKIVMISTDRELFDTDSNVSRRILEQASLVKEMHVVVFTPKDKKFKKFNPGRHLTVHPTFSAHKFFYLLDAWRIGKEILKKEKADHEKRGKWLITTQDPFETGLLGFMLARRFRLPLHVQLHTDPFSREWQKEKIINRIRFLLARFLLTHAQGIRVVSERILRSVSVLGIPLSRITKIPIFVDVEKLKDAEPNFDLHRTYAQFSNIILSIGRLQPEKNFNGLIRAFAKVYKLHPDAFLLIVGSGPERERILSIARSLEIHNAVAILPWARDVASYYKTCDIYVQPSLYEGWGMAVVEAMASGAPVVMTDVGCAGEVVRNNETGLVVKPGNDIDLSEALLRLLSDKKLRKELSRSGLIEVSKLATKAETLMLYKESWEKALTDDLHITNKT